MSYEQFMSYERNYELCENKSNVLLLVIKVFN